MNAPIDVTSIRIETPRLVLRPWQETDLADFHEYARMEGLGQMAGWLPHKDMEESRKILDLFIRHKKTLALELKENGKVIGSLGIEELSKLDPSFNSLLGREIGYAMSRDYWGKGLMPEAVRAVTHYCFTVLGYDFLSCCHFAWNSQSRRVIEKCGFSFYGEEEVETSYGKKEQDWKYILRNPNKK